MRKINMRRRNDCYTVCLAMLLGMDYDSVPLFFDKPEDVESQNFNELVDSFLNSIGLTRICITVSAEWIEKFHRGYAIVSGPSYTKEFSDAGAFHAVIYKDGELYHDPNPIATSIIVPEMMDIIYPKNYAEFAKCSQN